MADFVKLEQKHKVLDARFEVSGVDWKTSVLMSSDHHYDSVDCDRKMVKRHFDICKENDLPILIFGDFFDAMQGKSDKRSSKGALDPQLLRTSYINALVDQATEFLAPYADNIIAWSPGNHETAIQKYAEVDLIELTADRIQGETGVEIPQMPYAGWIFFRGYKGNRLADTIRMAYKHGSGGGGPVTKGTIQASRRANYLPDANIVVSGHIHESWTMEFNRERITTRGELFQDTQWHICLPSYKDEYGESGNGWWHETGKSPRPKGAYWLDLSMYHDHSNNLRMALLPRRAI